MTTTPHPPWLVYLRHHCAGLDVGTLNDGGPYAFDDDALTSLWMDDGLCVAEWAGTVEEGSIRRTATNWHEAASALARAVYGVVGDDPDYMALIDLRDDLPWKMDLPVVTNDPARYIKRGDFVTTNDAIYLDRDAPGQPDRMTFSNLEADADGFVTAKHDPT